MTTHGLLPTDAWHASVHAPAEYEYETPTDAPGNDLARAGSVGALCRSCGGSGAENDYGDGICETCGGPGRTTAPAVAGAPAPALSSAAAAHERAQTALRAEGFDAHTVARYLRDPAQAAAAFGRYNKPHARRAAAILRALAAETIADADPTPTPALSHAPPVPWRAASDPPLDLRATVDARRQALGLTWAAVARRVAARWGASAKSAGETLSRWRRGQHDLPGARVAALLDALGLEVAPAGTAAAVAAAHAVLNRHYAATQVCDAAEERPMSLAERIEYLAAHPHPPAEPPTGG